MRARAVSPAGPAAAAARPEVDLREVTLSVRGARLCVSWRVAARLRAGTILSLVLRRPEGAPLEINTRVARSTAARPPVLASGFGEDGDETERIPGSVRVGGTSAVMRVDRSDLPPIAPQLHRFEWAAAVQLGEVADAVPPAAAPTLRFPP